MKWFTVVGVIFLTATVITGIISMNQELRLSGAIVNVDVTPDGYVMLQDGYFQRIGGQEGKETVELHNMQFDDPYTTTDQTYALDVYDSIMSMVAAQVLDYIMFDELALSFFLDPELLLDLRQIFTEEELAQMGSAVIWLEMADTGERIPMAIHIGDTEFFRTQMESGKDIYLSFAITTPRKEACLDFWYYIKGGQTNTLQTALAGAAVDVQPDEALLTEDLFEALGCVTGDHRVELTRQSLIEGGEAVLAHLRTSLQDGTLDYVLCTDNGLQALEDTDLLDLRSVVSEQVLSQLESAAAYRGDVPVAVDLSALGAAEQKTWLVFSAGTKREEACKVLWELLTAAQ